MKPENVKLEASNFIESSLSGGIVQEFGHELRPTGDAEALVEVFDVDVDGMGGKFQLDGHFFFAVAGKKVLEGITHSGR